MVAVVLAADSNRIGRHGFAVDDHKAGFRHGANYGNAVDIFDILRGDAKVRINCRNPSLAVALLQFGRR